MTEPTEEAEARIDKVRERERGERDTEIAEELEHTERIAGVLSSEVNPDEVLEITSESKPPIHLLTFRHS